MSEHYATSAGQVPRGVQRIIERRDARIFQRVDASFPVHEQERYSIVEIGPGLGSFARHCGARGWDYLAVEASRRATEALRADGIEVIESRVPPLPALPRRVDVIFAAHVVEHLRSGYEVAELLAGCRRALRPGGRVILVFPDASIWGSLFWEADYSHHWPASRRRLRQVSEDAGLRWIGARNMTLGRRGLAAVVIGVLGRGIPWRLAGRLPVGLARSVVGLRILLMPETMVVLEVDAESQLG